MTTFKDQLAHEWHPVKNTSPFLEGDMFESNQKGWWLCDNGHEWRISPLARVSSSKETGCPNCAKKTATTGVDDLQALFPEIAAQWHKGKNAGLQVNQIHPLSTQKVWWVCDKGHEYRATVHDRTQKKWLCLKCFPKSVSQIATRMHEYLEETGLFTDMVQEKNMVKEIFRTTRVDTFGNFIGVTPIGSKTGDSDAYRYQQGVIFEYDGEVFHDGTVSGNGLSYHMSRDLMKAKALIMAGYKVVRIRSDNLPYLNYTHPNFLQLRHDFKNSQPITEVMDEAIAWLTPTAS